MIVKRYRGFIVIGQSQRDFETKCRLINDGRVRGFYTEVEFDTEGSKRDHIIEITGLEVIENRTT